jgi:hypothetical protein
MTEAHSLHEVSNGNRCKLIYFAMSNNMVISSTYFQHKAMHKRIQTSPNGTVFNQLDHILIERQFASSILDVRSYHGANCDSDHYLVNISFRCTINISRPIKGLVHAKINTENLNGPINLNELQIINKGNFTSGNMNMGDTIEEIWKKVKTNIFLVCNT